MGIATWYKELLDVFEGSILEQHSFLDQMSMVNSIDWAYNETHILSGSQDDMALLWDADTLDNVSRSVVHFKLLFLFNFTFTF